MDLTSEALERLAHKRAGARLGWYAHTVVYVLVALFTLAISQHGLGSRPWSIYPLAVWGVGLLLHGLSVLLLGTGGGVQARVATRDRQRSNRPHGGS